MDINCRYKLLYIITMFKYLNTINKIRSEPDILNSANEINRMSKITDNIYLSNWNVATNPSLLAKNNIKTIICINKTKKQPHIMDMYKGLDIKHYHFDLDDLPREDISKYFDGTYGIMNDTIAVNKQNVLVHCTAGISRSTTIVLYYILRKYINRLKKNPQYQQLNNQELADVVYNKIFSFVKSKRSMVCPNPGFVKLLKIHTLNLLQ